MSRNLILAALSLSGIGLGTGSALGDHVGEARLTASVRAQSPEALFHGAVEQGHVEVSAPEWAPDRLLVSAQEGAALSQIAADYRAELVRDAPPGGYGVLAVPPRWSRDAFLNRLRDDTRIADISRMPVGAPAVADGYASAE